LAAELRSGAPESAAFAAAAAGAGGSVDSLAPLLAPAAAAVARGASVSAELGRVALAPGAHRLLPVANAWAVATRHGSAMTRMLDRLADAYDDEDAVRADLSASVAGSRASMLLLAALPFAGLLLGSAVGARPWAWLLGGPTGWLVCLVASGLEAAGFVVLPASGTWFITVDLAASGLPADDVMLSERLVREAKVASIPVSAFYAERPEKGFLRLCFTKDEAVLDEAVARLAAFRAAL